MIRFGAVILILAGATLMPGCGGEELPSRDQIPILKQNLYALEQGLVSRDRAAIDSLLSVKILDSGQDSDSLLRFVYGPGGDWPFTRLGGYEIFYTNQAAVITCFIMDSTEQHDRPIKLEYHHDDTLWLLQRFGSGEPDTAASS